MTVKNKFKILMIITVPAVFLFLYSGGVSFAATAVDDQYGVYYRHGRVFGKVIQYDPARDLVVVFGSVFVSESGGQWRLVESRKFHLVNPVGNDLRQILAAAVGRTVGVEGQLNVWPGQKEEVLAASSVDFQDYRIDTPPWYAFGVTVRPEKIYKFNLNNSSAVSFVDGGGEKFSARVLLHARRLTSLSVSEAQALPQAFVPVTRDDLVRFGQHGFSINQNKSVLAWRDYLICVNKPVLLRDGRPEINGLPVIVSPAISQGGDYRTTIQ